MEVESVTSVFFSPTGTTRRVLGAVVVGLGAGEVQEVDLTTPKLRAAGTPELSGDLVVVGVPVYEERVPPVVVPPLEALAWSGKPAVVVAVYGNVGVGVALRQLAGIAARGGSWILGGASFVGEHSFCHEGLAIARGRPDADDLARAREFGVSLREKLSKVRPGTVPDGALLPGDLPGKRPLVARLMPERGVRWFTRQPAVDADKCVQCGACARACPTGAIDPATLAIEEKKCRRCFACVKKCPKGARSISLRKEWLVRKFFGKALTRRREPRLYL
ncbi:MAG: 4Fe-4S binding protein [Promethearchaeota archaeon]